MGLRSLQRQIDRASGIKVDAVTRAAARGFKAALAEGKDLCLCPDRFEWLNFDSRTEANEYNAITPAIICDRCNKEKFRVMLSKTSN